MFDRRTKKRKLYLKDSMEMMSENERLQQAIKESVEKQTLYLEAENVEIPESNASKCRTLVSTGRTKAPETVTHLSNQHAYPRFSSDVSNI